MDFIESSCTAWWLQAGEVVKESEWMDIWYVIFYITHDAKKRTQLKILCVTEHKERK